MSSDKHSVTKVDNNSNDLAVLQATHKGDWQPPGTDITIECYVLENKERVLSLRGTKRTMGLKGGGALALPRMLKAKYIEPYLSEELKQWLKDTEEENVQKIRPPGGGNLFTVFKASLLVDVADAFYQAKNNGAFEGEHWEFQKELADRLHKITLAFSKVGIDAIIDEVTGYQDVRENNSLQKLLDLYVQDYFQPWQKRFPESFYKEIYRLKEWEYTGSSKRPYIVSQITNKFIYDHLPADVMEEVRQRKQKNEKLHQWLTSETGLIHLEKQLASATTLMRASDTWEEFEKLFARSFNRNYSEQQTLF